MKRLLLAVIAFFFMCGMAWSTSNVTFEWDANTEPDLAGYRLYQSQTAVTGFKFTLPAWMVSRLK